MGHFPSNQSKRIDSILTEFPSARFHIWWLQCSLQRMVSPLKQNWRRQILQRLLHCLWISSDLQRAHPCPWCNKKFGKPLIFSSHPVLNIAYWNSPPLSVSPTTHLPREDTSDPSLFSLHIVAKPKASLDLLSHKTFFATLHWDGFRFYIVEAPLSDLKTVASKTAAQYEPFLE